MNSSVKNYIRDLAPPQKKICEEVRGIILRTFPGLEETFKNGVPWYEDKFYIIAHRDHVNIGFSVTNLTEEEMSRFEGNGAYMRHIKIYSADEIDEKKIVALLKLVR